MDRKIKVMIEQNLKEDENNMLKSLMIDVDEAIQEKLKGSTFEIKHIERNESVSSLYSPFLIIRITKAKSVNLSFHVTIRSDIAFHVFKELKEIKEIKRINIIDAFFFNTKDGKLLYGNEAEQLLLIELRKDIIKDFINEQTQLLILKNYRSPYLC